MFNNLHLHLQYVIFRATRHRLERQTKTLVLAFSTDLCNNQQYAEVVYLLIFLYLCSQLGDFYLELHWDFQSWGEISDFSVC